MRGPVQKILTDTIKERLEGTQYDPLKSAQIAKELADTVKERVKNLGYERYKLVVQVTVGEKTGQALRLASRCLGTPRRTTSPGLLRELQCVLRRDGLGCTTRPRALRRDARDASLIARRRSRRRLFFYTRSTSSLHASSRSRLIRLDARHGSAAHATPTTTQSTDEHIGPRDARATSLPARASPRPAGGEGAHGDDDGADGSAAERDAPLVARAIAGRTPRIAPGPAAPCTTPARTASHPVRNEEPPVLFFSFSVRRFSSSSSALVSFVAANSRARSSSRPSSPPPSRSASLSRWSTSRTP